MLHLLCSWSCTHGVSSSLVTGTASPVSRAHPAGVSGAHPAGLSQSAGKLDGPRQEGASVGPNKPPLVDCDVDVESVYSTACDSVGPGVEVIYQNIQRLASTDKLFYTSVTVNDAVELRALVDSGSMACSLSSEVVPRLEQAGVLSSGSLNPVNVVLVGCGGLKTAPVGKCELVLTAYGHKASVPVLVVDGQIDELIIGSNLIKHLMRLMRKNRLSETQSTECIEEDDEQLFSLLANVERWRGSEVPDKVGTLRLKRAVTLEPMQEHLVWTQLKNAQNVSAGSAVVIEPTSARSRPRNILIGRTVALLRNDGWLPVKIINPLPQSVTLRRNAKVADAFPCMALEDFDADEPVVSVEQHVLQMDGDSEGDNASADSLTIDSVPECIGRGWRSCAACE